MKNRLKQTLLGFLYGIILCAVLSMCTSCRTRYIEVPTVHEEYVYQTRNRVVHDSIYTRDSIRMYIFNDTVYQDRWHTKYISNTEYILRTDTLVEYKEKAVPYEVIKKVTDYRGWFVAIAFFLIALFALISRKKS